MRGFIRKNRLAIIICFLLFMLPFFWMKPGEMDLGGDGNRLYYYDPKSYIEHDGLFLFDNVIEGIRTIEPHFYNIPYVLTILAAKAIIPSTYVLLSLINGLKLSLSFLSVYLIVKTIIQNSYKKKNELLLGAPAILTGLFYAFSPIMIGNYEKALLSHNQVFLNPLIFYFLLKYFLTQKLRYMIIPIVLSLIFAPSFSWIAAPPFFAFFPLAVLFLLIYIIFIQKQKIILSHIVIGIFLFFFLHAFHLVPELYSLFNPGSYTNERVFSENNIQQQLNYFYGVLPNAKLSLNILSHSTFKQFGQLAIIVPFFVLIGFILNKPVNKTFILTGIFFLITLYLLTANITPAGVMLYEKLFYIPGFSMFRNFIGQWAFVFSFFYALLLGQALFIIFKKIKSRYIVGLTILVSLFFIFSGWGFITGRLVNKPHFQSENVKIAMTMDPSYEKMLNHIKTLEGEGAVMSFPFTDCCYSVIHGKNDGAYVGTSPITMLTGRKDYNGYIIASPFSEVLLQLAKDKDYKSLEKLLGLLNIHYIFHNSDPRVYDVTFPGYPYSSVRQYFPDSQKDYKEFIRYITKKKLFQEGSYALYELEETYHRPHFYIAETLRPYDNTKNDWYGRTMSFFVTDTSTRSAYIERDVCVDVLSKRECKTVRIFPQKSPTISFERIDPTKYLVRVSNASDPYFLVFSESFHKNWNIFLLENKVRKFSGERQMLVNGYANGWLIDPSDVGNKQEYTLVVEMVEQRIFYRSLLISMITFVGLLLLGILILIRYTSFAIMKRRNV